MTTTHQKINRILKAMDVSNLGDCSIMTVTTTNGKEIQIRLYGR